MRFASNSDGASSLESRSVIGLVLTNLSVEILNRLCRALVVNAEPILDLPVGGSDLFVDLTSDVVYKRERHALHELHWDQCKQRNRQRERRWQTPLVYVAL